MRPIDIIDFVSEPHVACSVAVTHALDSGRQVRNVASSTAKPKESVTPIMEKVAMRNARLGWKIVR